MVKLKILLSSAKFIACDDGRTFMKHLVIIKVFGSAVEELRVISTAIQL